MLSNLKLFKEAKRTNIRDCGTADNNIDLTNDVNSNSETKCDGKITTPTQHQNTP